MTLRAFDHKMIIHKKKSLIYFFSMLLTSCLFFTHLPRWAHQCDATLSGVYDGSRHPIAEVRYIGVCQILGHNVFLRPWTTRFERLTGSLTSVCQWACSVQLIAVLHVYVTPDSHHLFQTHKKWNKSNYAVFLVYALTLIGRWTTENSLGESFSWCI